MKRIDFIDGLRALSIILVILEHVSLTPHFPEVLGRARSFYAFGKTGVLIFFVISGYLITSLLLREKTENHGRISVKKFYFRRSLRIFPVFYLFLIFIYLTNLVFNFGIDAKWIFYAATYTFNFVYPCVPILNHLWSLAVEEQFYFFWPWTVKFFHKKLWLPALFFIVAAPFIRTAAYLMPELKNFILAPFLIHADALMIGALTAILLNKMPELSSKAFFRSGSMRFFCFFMIWLMAVLSFKGLLGVAVLPFGNTVAAVSAALIIISFLRPADSLIYRVLTFPATVYFGKISYSLYIWQQFFFHPAVPGKSFFYNVFPLNLILTLIVSVISFELWEKKFLVLKDRYPARGEFV